MHYLCRGFNFYEGVNLIVEQGNTKLKAAIFDSGKIVSFIFVDKDETSRIEDIVRQYNPTQGILSSVVDTDKALVDYLREHLNYFLSLDEYTPIPIRVEYETKNTLGRDRIAAAAGACFLQPGRDLLVIDAGTAITYEVIESAGIYIGGNISPGLTTRFKALHTFTERLPLIREKNEVPLIGTSTESAILAGVVNGIVYEMDGFIDTLKSKYGDIFVFLTGGHSFYFERQLKNQIFADANLVLVGLNRILEYNAENN
ncbi:MAG: type III pantothenate kinase [Tannerella sp.]|jgi:type III pantothenate kinase|nr:type III pantothenate kinase [Tannerella sp.]